MLEEAMVLAHTLEMTALEGWLGALQSQLSDAADGGKTSVASKSATPQSASTLASLRATGFSLVREGDVWLIAHQARSFRLKHTRGLAMLSQLIDNPGREVHALMLGTDGDPGDLGDAGSAVDARAVRAYRDRIEALRERERTAELLADAEAADRARGEIDELASHLSAALGLGGKDRKAASAAERARVNVQRRIKDAIQRIAREDADLGRYLSLCIRTGTFSIFQPIE
jgi:non-specific serine/threonine protein kinase